MTDSPTLNDEFSYTGTWWLPENPKKTWSGSITYKPESPIELKLIDAEELPENVEVLHGLVWEKSSFVTLLSSRCAGENLVLPRGWRWINKRYWVKYLLLGRWFNSQEDLTSKLKSVHVTFSSLRGWLWLNPSSTTQEIDDKDITLRFKMGQELLELYIPAIESRMLFYEGYQYSSSVSEHMIIRDCTSTIEPSSAQTLDWFREQTDRTRDLLTFLAGIPMETKSNQVVIETVEDDGKRTESIDIYRYVRQVKQDDAPNYKMAFPFTHLGESTATVFQKWFDLDEDAQVPYRLCLDVINSEHRFWEFEFLALVQALESHHQIITGTYDDQIDLIERLEKLYNCLPPFLKDYVKLDEAFLRSVKDTRNYYTHYNPSKRERAYKDFDLYKVIARMIPFVAAVLYRELGIPDENILEAFQRVEYQGLWQRQIPREQKMPSLSEALRNSP